MIRYILLICISFVSVYSQEIAISFDDAPMPGGIYYKGIERTKILLEKLTSSAVPGVVFYCNLKEGDPEGIQRLTIYSEAGYLIANHTYSHSRIDRLGTEEYIEDIKREDKLIRNFPTYTKWFRYPFLDEGKQVETRDKIRNGLKELGYKNGYVTVDNYDWYINALFKKALEKGEKVDLEKLSKFFIDHIWESIRFYDHIAANVLGRSPKHVLLLHENDISALFIDDLVNFLRSNNWKIISNEEAYSDPISQIVPDVLFNGQGRIGSIAAELGYRPKDLIPLNQEEDHLDSLFAKCIILN